MTPINNEDPDSTGRVSAWVDRHIIERFRQHYPRQGSMSKLIRFAIATAIEVKENEDLEDDHVGRKLKRALK